MSLTHSMEKDSIQHGGSDVPESKSQEMVSVGFKERMKHFTWVFYVCELDSIELTATYRHGILIPWPREG
jgi:hypothetical protein